MLTYPLTIPGPPTPGPAHANPKKFDAVGEVIGEFDGAAQQQQWPDQHWEVDLEWPEMTWAQGAALDAFLGALHGKLGSFLWGPPLATGPRGLGNLAGSPVGAGSDASGSNLLHTQGWLPSQSGLLLPGDYFSLVPGNAVPFAVGAPLVSPLGFPAGSVELLAAWPPPGWVVAGASFTVAGTAVTDGGPFVMVSVELKLFPLPPTGTLQLTQIIFLNPAATGGTPTPGGTISWSGVPRLYQYVNPNPLASDGGGNATLDIWPTIREAPPAGMALQLISPQGTFRLKDNLREGPAARTKTITFAVKCREAV